jgi:hypothetical protein
MFLPPAALSPQSFERIALCFLVCAFCDDLLSGWRTTDFSPDFLKNLASYALVHSVSSALFEDRVALQTV